MSLPRLLVTGASGFVGRNLLDALKDEYRIFGLARRSQARCGAPIHPNIDWFQADVGDRPALDRVFDEIGERGGIDYVVHLAAHYDFTGVDHDEYRRTNVEGLRNVLEGCTALRPRRFVFSSSLAACGFSKTVRPVDENSPPNGRHVYARTKRQGEAMLADYSDRVPSVIVRFAALFSDWCEYPPLYSFLTTWLSRSWRSRIVGGRGRSAVPYLHIKDGVRMIGAVLERHDRLDELEVLLASPDGAVSHEELYAMANVYGADRPRPPIHMPRLLCPLGIGLTNLAGRFADDMPFERRWMARYIDRRLDVDASRTRERLGWRPRRRLEVLERLPFMIENLRADPIEWSRRNREAMKAVRLRPNLTIAWLIERHAEAIEAEFIGQLTTGTEFDSYRRLSDDDLEWHVRLILRHLQNAVRTGDRGVLVGYCRDLALRRHELGFEAREVLRALELLDRIVLAHLRPEATTMGIVPYLDAWITATIRFGSDQLEETLEHLGRRRGGPRAPAAP